MMMLLLNIHSLNGKKAPLLARVNVNLPPNFRRVKFLKLFHDGVHKGEIITEVQ